MGLIEWVEKIFCSDILINHKRDAKEFEGLKADPDNYKRRIIDYQIELSLKSKLSTDKNTRVIVVLSIIMALTGLIAVLIPLLGRTS